MTLQARSSPSPVTPNASGLFFVCLYGFSAAAGGIAIEPVS